jgi:ABC-type phosphate/phosphonate transport system substrate-binding protein
MNRRNALTSLTAAALFCLAGCGSDESPASPDKKPSAVTLRIVTYDALEVSGGRLVDHFVQEVTDLDPTIRVEPLYEAALDEQTIIELVQAGDADLGWSRAGPSTSSASNRCAPSTHPS